MVFVEFFTKAGWEKSGGAGCSFEGVRDQGSVVQLQNDWISGHHLWRQGLSFLQGLLRRRHRRFHLRKRKISLFGTGLNSNCQLICFLWWHSTRTKFDTKFSGPQNTQLHVLGDSGMTVIAAQARDSNKEDTGYSFVHCNITGTGSGTFLGRAWRASPQVVYAYTSMGKVINPEGWSDSRHPEYDK